MKFLGTIAALSLAAGALGQDVLKTDGFSTCAENSDFTVQRMDIQYDKATQKVMFDLAGSSRREQRVMLNLKVSAYGRDILERNFNPCDEENKVDQLCPLPSGDFAAKSELAIPPEFTSQIPDIAFNIPNIDGLAKLELQSEDGDTIACIQSVVNNGRNIQLPAVSYIGVGIAGAALIVSGLTALAAGGAGTPAPSPTFTETMGWFQSIAMNGMLSVQYPSVYRSFSENFAFSGAIVPWEPMQRSIDSFRASTGGDLSRSSVDLLKNTTLVFTPDFGTEGAGSTTSNAKRALGEGLLLFARQVEIDSANSTSSENGEDFKDSKFVQGVQAYAEKLMIPDQDFFMTALLVFAMVIAVIIVGILLFKVILEVWALAGKFPEKLKSFRKNFWWIMATTITNLIFVLYGIWVLYCVYQFVNGDSWGPKLLAGVTLAIFTGVLLFFTIRIWSRARKFSHSQESSDLFENKETWRKYSILYGDFKKGYWWLFIPTIVYMFAKGCVIAGANGNGLAQVGGQLIVEAILLVLLLWSRPYQLKAGNWINITIQVVRVISVLCILVFVNQLKVEKTTQTIAGLALVIVQAVLTGLLAILIAVNAIVLCCKENPHRKKRKDQEKMMSREIDALTPLDARNSLLLDPNSNEYKGAYSHTVVSPTSTDRDSSSHLNPYGGNYNYAHNRSTSDTRTHLLSDVGSNDRGASPDRAPRLPEIQPTSNTGYNAYRPY